MTRGDVFRIRLGRSVGHEQGGDRLGVVVQANALLPRSTVLIAPTSASPHLLAHSFRPEIDTDRGRTRVIVEQTKAVDMTRLGDLVGRVTPQEMWTIDDALRIVFELH